VKLACGKKLASGNFLVISKLVNFLETRFYVRFSTSKYIYKSFNFIPLLFLGQAHEN